MSNMSQPGRAHSVTQKTLHKTDYFFRNITKAKLLLIGFTQNQYMEFMEDTEQLCGKFGSSIGSTHGFVNHQGRARLYDLAQTYLFQQWNSIVQASVPARQQTIFWDTWLESCLKNVNVMKRSNKWHQTKHFDGQSQADLAPAVVVTFTSTPGVPTSTITTPAFAIAGSSPVTDPLQTPSQSVSLDMPTSVQMKSETTSESPSKTIASPASVSWRNVVLRVSFKNLPVKNIRPMNVPLIRCVDTKHQDFDEDSNVIATWLDFSSLQSLVTKHLSMSRRNTDLGETVEFTLCAYFGTDQRVEAIYCSNDFHIAYNKWVCQKHRLNNDFWLVAVEDSIITDVSDSDIPDAVNPLSPSKGIKRRKK